MARLTGAYVADGAHRPASHPRPRSGGYLLADHLADAGCRRARFVAQPGSAATVDARIAGCREVLARRGLDHAPGWAHSGDPADPAFVRGVLDTGGPGAPVDGLVCANDETAARLMRTLAALGVRVPADVRVVGFDDVSYATLLSVPLTTIHQPTAAIGTAAVHAMLQRLATPALPPREILLHAPLVVRESSGGPPRTATG